MRGIRTTTRVFARSGALLLLVAAAVLLLAGRALSGSLTYYPDLVAEAPGAAHLEIDVWPEGDPADPTECHTTHSGDCRLLMQYDGFVTNLGDGPVHIEGNPQLSGGAAGQVAQKILDDDNNELESFWLRTPGDTPLDPDDTVVQYETTDDHNHFHLMKIMEFSLWDLSRTSQVVAGEKVGFCLFDSSPVSGFPDPQPGVYDGGGNFCQQNNPGATSLEMGTTEGWRDVYSFNIKLQWLDITDLAPGQYYLAARPDPENWIVEMDETNNGYVWASSPSTIPGHVAQDMSVEVSIATEIDLEVETYVATIDEEPADGTQDNVLYPKGTREFTLESLPTDGTLTQNGVALAVGTPFTEAGVTYTPNDGYLGPDSFTFSAADSASPYPINPVVATVSIDVVDNEAPSLVRPPDQSNDSGTLVGIGLSVSDPDGDPVTITADGLPPGVDVFGTVLSGTPLIPGTYVVDLTADDGKGGVDTKSFTWTITGDLILPFDDVGGGHLFAEDITWMYALGISLGCGDGSSYCPDQAVSREQVASFVARAFELVDGAGSNAFADDDGSVHEENIDRLSTAGITNGCAVDLYCPGDLLTRAQFASLLIRALEELAGEDYGAAVGLDYFSDDDGLVHEENIDKLRYADVTRGCGVSIFCPLDSLTRGQLAALLYRALG